MTRTQVQKQIREDLKTKQVTISALAKKMKIGYATLYRFVKDGEVGTISVWERIESYYRSKGSKKGLA